MCLLLASLAGCVGVEPRIDRVRVLGLWVVVVSCECGLAGLWPRASSKERCGQHFLIHWSLTQPVGEGNGNPLQYSCLENPMDRGAWRATRPWGRKSWTRLSD